MYTLYCLSKDLVREIINGTIKYDNIPQNRLNKLNKKKGFENQVKVNLELEKNHKAVCSVLEQACKKQECPLFQAWDIRGCIGGGCQEYKIDFPNADFDLRYHVGLIGTNNVDIKLSKKNLEELQEKGARHYCSGCGQVYEKTKNELENNEKILDVCSCEDFLFKDIGSFIDLLKNKEG